MQQAEERARRKAETYKRRMAALGLPLEGTPDYIPARQQATQYMQPDAFSVEFGYGQPVYPAMYPVAPGNLPEYLNTAPSAALQWEMPQPVLAGRRSGQVRQSGQAQQAYDPGMYQSPPAYGLEGHQEPNHGRRSHVSPSRRRAATAHAPQAAMPTVKDMHLQRVATMAAAQATAQATNADMTSHEQFARDLRSYRGQMAGGGVRTPSKPAWDSEPSSGAGLFDEGSSYLPGALPGELMWQTSGRPHQLQAPAIPQQKPLSKSPGRRRPVAASQAKATPWDQAGPDPAGPAAAFSAYQPQQAAPDTPPDPPDMPGINRAGLLNLRNKLRLNRPALISPPTNTQSAPLSQPYPHDLSHGLPHDLPNRYDASVSQQTLSGPYQAVPPPSSNAASPVKTAAAAARLARRRAVAQEVGNPGADATMSPGDVRRGKFAPQQETPSSSSSSSSRATSSSSSSSHATSVGTFTKGDRNPMGQVPSSKGFNRAPSKQTQGALASPQGRASDAARSGSNRDPDQAPGQGRLAKGRALARGPGSIAEDPEGQGRLPKGRTTEESPSGSSSFAGDALGPGANALQADAPSGDLMQCEGCGRSFNQRAFEVHSRICAKIFQSKRKAFNIAEARVADTGAAQFFDARKGVPKAEAAALPSKRAARGGLARGGSGLGTPSHAETAVGVKGKSGAKWRNQSEQLRIAMAASKGGPEAKVTAFGGAPIASAPDPSLIPCPHCGRRFNETAAERHIPKCSDIRAKPSRLMAGAGQKRQPALSPGSRGGWG